jgi:hypothetical protein
MRTRPTSRFAGLLAGTALALSLVSLAPAQVGGGRDVKQPRLQVSGDLNKMRNDQMPLDAKTMADMADWLVYRLTWDFYRGEKDPRRSDQNYTTLIDEASRQLIIPGKKPFPETGLSKQQLAYVRAFGAEMDKRIREVLKSPYPIVAINAARMLAECCRSGYEGHADTIVMLLNDPKVHDAIKYQACTAAKNLLAVPGNFVARNHAVRDSKKLDELVKALTAYVFRKVDVTSADATMDAEVAQYLRREAVRALAQMRFQVLRDQEKLTDRPTVLPGFTLWQVAMGDGSLQPPPSTSERIEGLIGFCNMPLEPDVNIDYAAYGVGLVLSDLVRVHNAAKQNTDKALPWKLTAARLGSAMHAWRENAKKVEPGRNPEKITSLVNIALPDVLEPIERDGLSATPNAQNLLSWLQQNPIRSKMMFEKVPTTVFTQPKQ